MLDYPPELDYLGLGGAELLMLLTWRQLRGPRKKESVLFPGSRLPSR